MKNITEEDLAQILADHAKWRRGVLDGKRACLRGANLIGANLRGAVLIDANLRDAVLVDANLREANLREANLTGANLIGANLIGANLRGANLRDAVLVDANLREANLTGANLTGANLIGANLIGANLIGAVLIDANLDYFILPEEGSFIAWKAARSMVDGRVVVLKLQIPDTATRSCCYFSRKCRASQAIPISAYEKTGAEISSEVAFCSDYEPNFIWQINKQVESEHDQNPSVECSTGLHIFITRKEAERWL